MNLCNTITGVVASTNFRGAIPLSLMDSVEIDGIYSPVTGSPTGLLGRIDTPIELNANAYYQGDPVTGVAYTWYISDSATGSAIDVLTGQTPQFISSDIGKFDIRLEVTSLNSFDRQYRRGIVIDTPNFLAADADLLIDLNQVRSNTWSNPLANLTYTGGNNANFDFQDVVRAGMKIGIKGTFSGRSLTIIGLVGADGDPVHIQNVDGPAVFNSTSDGQVCELSTGCQYITIDGKGTADEYGFQFNGRTTAGTQSQLLFLSGSFIKGIRIFGCDFDQKRGSGATDGGACFQFSTTFTSACNGTIGDPGFFTPAYVEGFFCRFQNCWDEGNYLGHFDDAVQPSGFRPYRLGDVLFFRNAILTCGRDGFQVASSDSLEAHDLYIDTIGLENNASHNSIISFNDGNQDSYIYRIVGQNGATYCSGQNGDTGQGEYHFYSFRFIQGTFGGSTPNQAMFLNVENATCNFHVMNATMKCPDVVVAPVCIQYDNPGSYVSLDFTFAGCAISTGTADGPTWDELRTVNTGGTDRTGWLVDNIFELTADESDLKLELTTWRPDDPTSPVYGAGFDWDARFGSGVIKGGQRDEDGYSLTVDTGSPALSAGCFSGFELYVS